MKPFLKLNPFSFLSLVLLSFFSISNSWAQCSGVITPITFSNIKSTSADVTWPKVPTETPGIGRYIYEVRTSGDPGIDVNPANGYVASGYTDNGTYSTTINDLKFNTNYYFYVRYRCQTVPVDAFTPWQNTDSVGFTTLVLGVPNATEAIYVSDVSFVAKWDPVAGADYYLLDVSDDETFSSYLFENEIVTGISFPITGLDPETMYYYRLRAVGEGNGVPPNEVTTIEGNTIEVETLAEALTYVVWNGDFWSGDPDFEKDAIIEADYNTLTDGDFESNQLIVNTGVTLVIASGTYVRVEDAVLNSGTITLQSNANLVQGNNITTPNVGNITVERNSSSLWRLDYTMWSSPLSSGQTLKQFSPDTEDRRFYTYNTATDKFNVYDPANTFQLGKGYLIRMPKEWVVNNGSNAPQSWLGSFNSGIPNNGTISVPLTPGTGSTGYNMVGNPYPSLIDAYDFIVSNSAKIHPVIYFWRRTNSTAGGAINTYYATYTRTGGTGEGVASTSSGIPNGFIAVGQGFLVRDKLANTANEVVFTQALRVSQDFSNQFFKSTKNASSAMAEAGSDKIERNRFWLDLTNDSGVSSQMLIGYVTGATNELDDFDGEYLSNGNEEEVAMGSAIDNVDYVIQGRALPFLDTDVVPMYLKTPDASTFTITLSQMDGLFAEGQNVYIKDKLTNITHDIKESPYTFATEAGIFTDRFEVVYNTSSLSTKNPTLDANAIVVYKNNQVLNINAGAIAMKSVELYDMSGRVIYKKQNVDDTKLAISNLNFQDQVIIIKISTEAGIVNKKYSFTR